MNLSILRDDLISWWAMEEDPALGIIKDKLIRNQLTAVNGVGTTGHPGGAVEFNSAGTSRLYAPSNGLLQLAGRRFTFALWVKFSAITGSHVLLSKTNSSPISAEYRIEYDSFTTTIAFRAGNSTGSRVVLAFNGAGPPAGVWQFIVCWIDSKTGYLHIRMNDSNYENVSTDAIGSSGIAVDSTAFNIGSNPDGTNPLKGAVGTVAVWGRMLTRAEQGALWNEGAGLTYEDTAPDTCKTIVCCDNDDFDHKSSALDTPCPPGYVWGGLSCLRTATPQSCSPGWFWDGIQCVEGTTVVCAPGYHLSGGVCVACDIPAAPALTPGVNQIALSFNVAAGLSYNIFRSTNGDDYVLLASDTGGAGVESYTDATTVGGKTYYYYVSVYVGSDCGFIDGLINSAVSL